jgi:hypothetical protein
VITDIPDGGPLYSIATVTLSRPGFTQTITTSLGGDAYFAALTPASDYTLTMSAPFYIASTLTDIVVSGDTTINTSLTEDLGAGG